MKESIQINTSKVKLELEAVGKLFKQQLSGSDFKIPFSLAVDPTELFVSVSFPANIKLKDDSQVGANYEGLWEATVFELFIGQKDKENYIEINLAPHGGWWIQNFNSHRKRAKNTTAKIRSLNHFSTNGWSCNFAINKDSINLPSLEKIEVNIAAVITRSKSELLSYNELTTEKIDFHSKELRTTAKIVLL